MDLLQDNIRDEHWKLDDGDLLAEISCYDAWAPIHRFCIAVINYYLFTRVLDPNEIITILSQHGLHESFLAYQVEMQEKAIGTTDPRRRGESQLYHKCFFHQHTRGGEENECLEKMHN
jgi:hypothetical protein